MLDLVIPDTGPLITLGLIGRLDLLDRFDCPILVTDMIQFELLRGPADARDRPSIQRWLDERGNRVQSVETLYGTMWKSLSEERRREVKRMFPDAGEQSIREFAQRVKEVLPAEDQILVLFEDERVKGMSFGNHVHLLHTYSFMVTLERLGVIASAEALHADVVASGRNLAKDLYERRAVSEDGEEEDWQEGYSP